MMKMRKMRKLLAMRMMLVFRHQRHAHRQQTLTDTVCEAGGKTTGLDRVVRHSLGKGAEAAALPRAEHKELALIRVPAHGQSYQYTQTYMHHTG
jgi:hypothetical protein